MILPSDAAKLQGSRLLPNATSAIAGIAAIRAATVATSTYQTFPINSSGVVPISYTFAAGGLTIGNQVRLVLYGTVSNAVGAPQGFVPVLRVRQSAVTQTLGITAAAAPGLDKVWRIDAALSFSSPGAANAGIGIKAALYTSTKKPNSVMAIGGYLSLLQTDTAFASPTQGGGIILAGAAITNSAAVATIDPNNVTMNNTQPIQVAIEMSSGVNTSFTVQGGWMEAM